MNIALVIIDMQNDFVLPEAPLCVKGAQATVPTIQNCSTAHARKAGA